MDWLFVSASEESARRGEEKKKIDEEMEVPNRRFELEGRGQSIGR